MFFVVNCKKHTVLIVFKIVYIYFDENFIYYLSTLQLQSLREADSLYSIDNS